MKDTPLLHVLIEHNIKKEGFRFTASLASNAIANMGKGKSVETQYRMNFWEDNNDTTNW